MNQQDTVLTRTYCVATVLHVTASLDNYLRCYLPFYCRIQRDVFQELKHGVLSTMKRSEYVSMVCQRYGILKRTANSVINDMSGRISAYRQLKQTELTQLADKLESVNREIDRKEKDVGAMKLLAAANKLAEDDLGKYRAEKSSLYYLKNKRNRLTQKKSELEKQIKEGHVSICFGSKEVFAKQYNLDNNGYRTHTSWHHDFVRRRDSGIFYLGSGDEACGNQILQLHWTGQDFQMELLKDRPFRENSEDTNGRARKDDRIVIEHVTFPYMQEEIREAISKGQPVTFRISRKHNRWYLAAMFKQTVLQQTCRMDGVFGVDYNNGFMEVAETNRHGNLVSAEHIPLDFHGTGNHAESEIKEKLSKLVRHARECGKDIIVEDLDFIKKKAKVLRGKGKNYNRMIHAFDYHRYLFWMENLCNKYGVGFKMVNPAFTSRIGEKKYARPRKLTIHRAAALVIARRGQGFRD